ncbi:RNA-directed DNA polymerase [Niastella sp. OAS944]|uniref:RNA-directed DNA polymerase n=1 Tax=Niastella sp. OAS944 TaxID=2664089 RepID=UPI0034841550|nr:hypothetical protein [Chitinophagaceae bacterium OAS944]
MAYISDTLKKCAVKIVTSVCGVPSTGSGIVYETSNNYDYNYILTAKHLFQEDTQIPLVIEHVISIDVFYSEKGKLKKLQSIKKAEIKDRLITFDDDFAIVIIEKSELISFEPIIVTDKIEEHDLEFFSWAVFSANENELHFFEFKRNDSENKRIKLITPPSPDAIQGISGGGVFIKNRLVLYGIICRYPNDNLENDTIDCTLITFDSINKRLLALKRVPLDTTFNKHKREIKNIVVDIHQATINNVCLNLEMSRRRLKTDIVDDWFHDPLKYIDLLNQEFLFKQFEELFNENKYKTEIAEQFYVPKKKLSLRQALVSPFIDRIMYMAAVGVLADKMDCAMIPTVYSARYNRFSKNQLILNGVEQWKKMKYFLAKKVHLKDSNDIYQYGCIIEIDLLNFYDNINKTLLIEKIKRICTTENEINACDLLNNILQGLSEKALGIPQNSDASSLLASFYLNQVDTYMYNRTFGYYRFMDDIKILCKNKYEGRKILQLFEFELRRCDLSVNSQKTKIRTIVDHETENEDEVTRNSFNDNLFDIELNKISRLRKSENYAYLNQAFHLSIELLDANIQEDIESTDIVSQKLNYALNTIELLGKKTFVFTMTTNNLLRLY